MVQGTCSEVQCDRPIRARGVCNGCYQRLTRTGVLAKLPVWRPSPTSTPIPIVFGSVALPERVWQNAVITDEGCWAWTTGARDQGYGVMTVSPVKGIKVVRRVHVLAYEAFIGPVPIGLILDHLCHADDLACHGPKCRHRACFHPEHVEPVTSAENTRRGHHIGCRPPATHCPQGHPYIPPHLAFDKDGYADCRTCRNRRWRERYQRRKQEALLVKDIECSS